LAVALVVGAGGGTAFAGRATPVPVGAAAPVPDSPGASIAPDLRGRVGRTQVVVQLARASLTGSVAEGAIRDRTLPTKAGQKAQLDAIKTDQDAVSAAARSLGGRELARINKSLNALVLDVDASRVADLAAVPGVVSIRPVRTYETQADPSASGSLEQAATYLQVDALRANGYDGTGVRVAVLDSGIDYTHANLGGPGTTAFYDQCYANATGVVTGACAAYFGPGAPKVKGGYDFVGESWPNTPEQPDPNPIDFEGHGTHVSDIIGGNSPSHKGLAPGVSLYAVRVCSAVTTSCSGIALLEAVDWALDPNGDGDMSDAVDLMNLSLGSDYGQDEDDLSFALDNAVKAGVVVVASAGNGADRGFKVGSPSIAARVISVAETALPDQLSYVINITSPTIPSLPGNQIRVTVLQPWGGPIPASPGLIGALVRPTGSPLGCATTDFSSAVTTGKVALVNRGTCAVSIKASNAQAAGATGMILVNNTGGAPPAFSYGGGGVITIPVLSVSQGEGNALVAAVNAGTVNIQVDPAQAIPLANSMVATSSRGPSIDGIRVKPDIGAPGAWLSAEVGTGNEETSFGGTSGAAPTVSGVAVLLLQKFPKEKPAAIKTRLLNGADMHNTTPDPTGNLYPTPISRIGAGEVRAFPSSGGTFSLASGEKGAGNIALGSLHLSSDTTVSRDVTIQNRLASPQSIMLSQTFRDAGDAALGALSVGGLGTVMVPPKGSVTVTLTFTLKAAKLAAWPLGPSGPTGGAGISGGDGTVLNGPELDGFILASSGSGETQHLGWHVLPHRSADVSAPKQVNLKKVNQAPVVLTNSSNVQDGNVEVFSLTGTSDKLPKAKAGDPGSPGSNVALVDLNNVGVRDGDGVIQFAIDGRDRRPTPLYPAGYEVDVDTNRDGTADYFIFQQEAGGFGASGQSVVAVQKASGGTSVFFYSIADYDSGDIVFTAPLSALGLVANQAIDFDVLAYDNYFSGLVTDDISGMTYTVGSPKFAATQGAATVQSTIVPANSASTLTMQLTGSAGATTESGLLFLYEDAASNEAGAVVAKL
jgi:minor extracellular serine protease Vpr